MEAPGSVSAIRAIMLEYAAISGLSPRGKTPRRYLWTDAFALCNLLELFRQTNGGEINMVMLATSLAPDGFLSI